MKLPSILRFALTAVVVLVAALVVHALWKRYMYSPWTRDARVRAEVVRIAPDVSGIVTSVGVRDNQEVKKGDVLFVIDQARFRYALDQAQANLAAAEAAARAAGASSEAAGAAIAARRADYEKAAEQSERRQKMPGNVISAEMRSDALATANSARATLHQAQAAREQATAAVQQAMVALDRARLDLGRTEVRAPVDGYVTNLDIHPGDYAAAGTARLALIDRNSYWIYGYFEETKLPYVHVGDDVEIRLMAGGARLRGRVDSIARGIGDVDNPTGANLLANVAPTFSWVRLAQRVPVRIAIDTAHLPPDLTLAAGMTATVVLKPGAAGG